MRPLMVLAFTVATAAAAQAPVATNAPVIEVISVKQHIAAGGGGSVGIRADGIYALNVPLQLLLNLIYKREIPSEQMIGLPGWVTTDHWDIIGKVAPEDVPKLQHLTPEQTATMRAAMLEQILRERFNYAAHKERVEGRVYVLEPTKGGIKIKAANGDAKPFKTPWNEEIAKGESLAAIGRVAGHDVPVNRLVTPLVSVANLGHPIIDHSGLTGYIDYALQWSTTADVNSDNGRTGEDLPTFFTALQEQLGLRLVPAHGPVTQLVVDHIKRPSAN